MNNERGNGRHNLNRVKTLIFRVTEEEYENFAAEARRRHMAKSELFRYLLTRYFFDDALKR